MGRNVKPILSVLIDEDKRDRFRRLADDNKLSMGWLINDCIDRMLEANSIDIYKSSIGDTDTNPKSEGIAVSQSSIEEIIKTYVDSCLQNISIGSTDKSDIEETVKTYVDNLNIEGMVRESIGTAIEPIEERLSELETYTKSQLERSRDELEAVRGEIKKPTGVTLPAPDDGDGGLTVKELCDRLNMKRQAIEDRRNNGTLAELGYSAEQKGRNWRYYAIEVETEN